MGIGGGAIAEEDEPVEIDALAAAFAFGGLPRSISVTLDCDKLRLKALALGVEEDVWGG